MSHSAASHSPDVNPRDSGSITWVPSFHRPFRQRACGGSALCSRWTVKQVSAVPDPPQETAWDSLASGTCQRVLD